MSVRDLRSTPAPEGRVLTYLVAHRSEERRAQLARSLTARGLRVRLASDAHRALAMAVAQPPDLVLAELTLPGFDGIKLARVMRLRDDLAGVPVVLLSHLADVTPRKRALKEDVDEVLVEPLDLEELFLRTQRVLRRSFQRPVTHLTALRGKLEDFGAASILGLLELDRKSGVLRVSHAEGQVAVLWLRDGNVVGASLAEERLEGADVVYALARWTRGTFAFKETPVDRPDAVGMTTSMLILEAARRVDES
jgi:DNA-binding response OmpR family regulator